MGAGWWPGASSLPDKAPTGQSPSAAQRGLCPLAAQQENPVGKYTVKRPPILSSMRSLGACGARTQSPPCLG